MQKLLILLVILLFFSCKPTEIGTNNSKSLLKNNYLAGSSVTLYDKINDTSFVNLRSFSAAFEFDLKYAATDNFLKSKVYDCAECYLRFKTVKKLIDANAAFHKLGFSIKIFDCYRPLDVQKKMWEIVPNPEFVADPKKGSIHNRGGAVDITIIDRSGKELDMGTHFDYFGPEASHDYKNLSEEILQNRLLLKKIMLENGFKSFDSEWWHYNLQESYKDHLANFKWDCK